MEWHSWRRRGRLIAARASTAHVSEQQLRQALRGVPYPAKRWELLVWAYFNGSGWTVTPTISELPEREYSDFHDVRQEALQRAEIDPVGEWTRQ